MSGSPSPGFFAAVRKAAVAVFAAIFFIFVGLPTLLIVVIGEEISGPSD